MRQLFLIISMISFMTACRTSGLSGDAGINKTAGDTLITQSLFNDKTSTISEDNISRILGGEYKLPSKVRIAIVSIQSQSQYRRYYWNDENYLKTQESYLKLFSDKLAQSPRVTSISIIPDLLISSSPTFTSIREAAVRMQADIVVIYSINGDIYSRYKLFSRSDIKAFATTQLILLDVRTGLIPFSAIVTKDALSQKRKEELNDAEANSRVQNEAVLLTINDIGQNLSQFLNKN